MTVYYSGYSPTNPTSGVAGVSLVDSNTLIAINGSGQITGIGPGNNTTVSNGAIIVDLSGNIVGIGTGNNTPVANTAITVDGGALKGIGIGNNTPVANSAISINADGTLTGAGSGQVTITGLGFLGDLDATTSDNLVANASLKTNTSRWSSISGLTRVAPSAGDPSAYFRAAGVTGSAYMNGGDASANWTQLNGSTRLYLSFWSRFSAVTSVTARVFINWWDASGALVMTTQHTREGSSANTWLQFKEDIPVPTGASQFSAYIYTAPGAGLNVDIAAVRISFTELAATVGGVFGVNILETGAGTTATLGNFKTILGTSAAIINQAATATSSDFSIITGATRPSDNATVGARAGTNIYRTDGITVMSQAEVRTVEGTAAAITGQAATATSSDFSVVTGATKPANNATVGARAGTNIYRTDGTTVMTQAEVRTVEGTAAAITAQGAFATINTAAYGSALLTGFGTLAPRNTVLAGTHLQNNAGTVFLNDADIITSSGTSAAIVGQGPGATAPGADVLNYTEASSTTYVARPSNGAYSTGGVVTGAIKIALPVMWTNVMMRFRVEIFDYATGKSCTYLVSGYNYVGTGAGGYWVNCSAQFIGREQDSKQVSFGNDGSKSCIWIGTPTSSWSFLSVTVLDFLGRIANASSTYKSGWAVTLDTATQGNPGPSGLSTAYPIITKPRAADAVFGENVFEAGSGTTATLTNFKTILGTSSAITGQAATATSSDFSVITGTTKPANNATVGARAGTNIYRTDGTTVMSQAEVRTVEGTAASITGQGAFATINTAAYGSALLTGFGTLAPRSTVLAGTHLQNNAGTVFLGDADIITSSGTSAAFVGQGVWATLNDPLATPIKLSGIVTADSMVDDMAYSSSTAFYSLWTNPGGGSGEITPLSDSGAPGGKFIRIGNNSGNDGFWGHRREPIPYDPSALYEVMFVVRQTSGSGTLYAGLVGMADDKTTLVNASGANSVTTQHYISAFNQSIGSSWTTVVGYVRGFSSNGSTTAFNDPASPGVMHSSVRYISPMLIANGAGGSSGQLDLAYVRIRRIDLARLGSMVTRENGSTILTDALAVTSLGTSAAITGQAATATSSDFSVITGATKPANNATVGARAGTNIYRTDGTTVMTQAEVRTVEGTAASITGQGAFATINMAAYGSALLTGFGTLAPRNTVLAGTHLQNNAGTVFLGDIDIITSSGTSAAIAGQAATATSSDFSVVTGATKPANNATVGARAGTDIYRTDGITVMTQAEVRTVEGTAAAITAQGALATKSSVDLSTSEVLNKSLANLDSTANTKLTGIESGADVTLNAQVIASPPDNVIINADYLGNIISGQFNKVLTPTVLRGGTNVRTDNIATYTVTNITGGLTGFVSVNSTTGSSDKGRVTVTNCTSNGTFVLNILWDSIIISSYVIQFTVVPANPPLGGGGGGGTKSGSVDLSGFSYTGTTFVQAGRIDGLVKAAGETIRCSLGAATYQYTHTASGTRATVGKFQYSVSGANSWTDVGSSVTGTGSNWYAGDFSGDEGSITVNQDVAPSNGTYDVRFVVAHDSSGGGNSAFTFGTMSVIIGV